jgi:hypothetical protein
MNKSDFQYNKKHNEYTAIINGFEIIIQENDYANEVVVLAQNILSSYAKKITDIAQFMSSNGGFISFYGNLSAEEIVQKLNQPKIEIQKTGGILNYLHHELDTMHIIDVHFSGVFEKFHELSIDG